MQIQRLTGSKSSFQLTIERPSLKVGKKYGFVHFWERCGDRYECKVFVEASRFPEQKNENFSTYHQAMPMEMFTFGFTEKEPDNDEEKLDILVSVSTLYVVNELVEEDVIEFFYEKYIESACEAYALVSVPLEQE